MGEGGLEDGLEEFAGVVEVFLGLGGGRRDPLKGFIQDPHDPLLLGKGRDGESDFDRFCIEVAVPLVSCNPQVLEVVDEK